MVKSEITADYVGGPIFDLIKRVELSKADHEKLMNHAKKKGILFLSTPFSKEAVDLLDELGVPAFKIGSGEMTNLPLVEYIASKGKPMIVSMGMSTLAEIKETVDLLKRKKVKFALLHCTSTYPTAYEDINLGFMKKLEKEFSVPIGLSDHSIGIYTALGAVALGACIIEKHFTISRNWPGPDQKVSIEPQELAELVRGVRAIEKALGTSKKVLVAEKPVQAFARESVVALVDIKKGSTIKKNMIWTKRPGTGIPAKEFNKVLGKKARIDIKKDRLIKWDDLE